MVTLSVERTPAISTVRGKRSPGCGNYATRRRIQSSTISRTISRCRCRRRRPGWRTAKARKMKRLRCCAEAEDVLGKHPVSPGAFVPIREQLGSVLLELGRPKDAQREFEAALKIYPGRFRGLYGAALAAEQTGDKENAGRYYARLAAQTSKSDGSRTELNHIREYRTAQAGAAQPAGIATGGE